MSKRSILVVDDSDFDRGLLVKALSMKGNFSTLEASSGQQCLEMIATHQIGLILMDILMPGEIGSDVLKKIREKYNAIELPIIMVTSKTDTADVISCLQAGANDYIMKPMNFEIAVSRISTHLKLAEISYVMAKLKETAALNAMITTYNHKINNPLAIAIGTLNEKDLNDPSIKEKLSAALWQVADIVKKIKLVTEKSEIEYDEYAGSGKMVKIK